VEDSSNDNEKETTKDMTDWYKELGITDPFFADDRVCIVHGDCREVLPQIPDESTTLVVTSPPYNKRGTSGWLVKKVSYPDRLPEPVYQEQQVSVLQECYRCLNNRGAVFYNHRIRYDRQAIFPVSWLSRTSFKIWQEIVLYRRITGNLRGWRYWNVDERIYWLVKNKPLELEQQYAQYTTVWDIRPENGNKVFTAPFPREIPRRVILTASLPNEVVIDPFLGSGTTVIVASKLNRKCIGIEISEEYCELATIRYLRSLSE